MRRFNFGLATIARSAGLAALVALRPRCARAVSHHLRFAERFDISNDTTKVCHGFEVQIEGVQLADYGGSFTANRYGTPVVAATDRRQRDVGTTYSPSAGWGARTAAHGAVVSQVSALFVGAASIYENGGCEHLAPTSMRTRR